MHPSAPPTTVGRFFEHARSLTQLSLLSGENYLERVIPEEAINRPGLALADFFQYFAEKRIQVFGLAEMTYLKSLDVDTRAERIENIFKQGVPCVVLTRNRNLTPQMRKIAEKYKVPVFRSPLITSRFINLATLVMESLVAPTLKFAGTMMEVMGIGVLIEGPPGIGKSEAALGLIERGFSLVADDLTVIHRDAHSRLICTSSELTRYHMEIRGLGIIHVPSIFGMASVSLEKHLDMIVSLYPADPLKEGDRSGLNRKIRNVLDIEVPLVELPVAPGRDMAGVIEVAAMNQKLSYLGHEAAKEFDQKLIRTLQKRRSILPVT